MPCAECAHCAADVVTPDAVLVCEGCVTLTHTRCGGCGEWHGIGSSCVDCLRCDRCQAPVAEAATVQTLRGSTICPECQDAWYWQCPTCDGWNRDGDACVNECCGDECDCEDCRDDGGFGAFGGLVHDYGFKPQPVFHGAGPLFLGAEIEVATPSRRDEQCADVALSHLGSLGYLKSDDTIGEGFEIVTHPMSYPWAIDHFPWKMLIRLQELGCAATEHTGLHVHVSRAGFASPGHTYRWMKFIYRNEPQVTMIARRSSPEWAAFTRDDRAAVKDYAKGACGRTRYRAINTLNPDTVELRVFASSLDPGEVQAALGFTAASVEYTRDLSVNAIARAQGWSWRAFTDWLDQQAAYGPLKDQLGVLRCAC